MTLADTSISTGSKPEGDILAYLVKRLISAEVSTGGPYRGAKGDVDPLTNIAIGYLFTFLNIPLPKVTAYIETVRIDMKGREVKELLNKYDALTRQKKTAASLAPREHIYQSARVRLELLEEPLKTLSLQFLARLKTADKTREIALFPRFFHDSLLTSKPDLPLDILCEANIYCWMAYSIYDHLLDGQPIMKYLPVANVAMRLSLSCYQELFPPSDPFQSQIIGTFTGMDTVNSWELSQCRFIREGNSITISSLPAYGQLSLLARRSFGHALGPLAVARLSGQSASELHSIEKGLRHYLIARQLCDDVHDWQEDIREGNSSAVATNILRYARVKPGTYDMDTLVHQMKQAFLRHSLQATNDTIRRHVHLSREHLLKSNRLLANGPFFDLLARLESITLDSTEEYSRYQNFAATYRKLS
jgi:hypothetical protein